jgi:hypothetical protein
MKKERRGVHIVWCCILYSTNFGAVSRVDEKIKRD